MDFIRIKVLVPSGVKRVMTVPVNVKISELIPELIGRMQLPTSKNDRAIVYYLLHQSSNYLFDSSDTVKSAEIVQDDSLIIFSESEQASFSSAER